MYAGSRPMMLSFRLGLAAGAYLGAFAILALPRASICFTREATHCKVSGFLSRAFQRHAPWLQHRPHHGDLLRRRQALEHPSRCNCTPPAPTTRLRPRPLGDNNSRVVDHRNRVFRGAQRRGLSFQSPARCWPGRPIIVQQSPTHRGRPPVAVPSAACHAYRVSSCHRGTLCH
jgi:hypothetical protein